MSEEVKIAAKKDAAPKKKKEESFRFYRVVRAFLVPLIKMLWPTEVVNRERFDEMQGGIVICNHYAVPDTLIPVASLYKRELHVLAKAEAFECAKIANWFLRKAGAIPVHRGEADINAVKEVLGVLRADKKLVMYPEGTRNREGTKEMLEFKQGAARFAIKARKPVLPMVYYRMHKVFRKNWLYIGEPIYLDEFYGSREADAYEKATQKVYDGMVAARKACDEYVEARLKRKVMTDESHRSRERGVLPRRAERFRQSGFPCGKHGKVYTIGALIHNEGVVRYLEERGVYAVTLAEARALPAGSVALIRAHGIPKEDEEFLRGRGIELYDATCPVVKRIQSIVAERSAAGDEIIIVGDRNHDEVLGAASYGKTSGWCRTARSWNFRIIPPAWCSRPPFLRTNSVKSAELRKIRKKTAEKQLEFSTLFVILL